MQQAGSIDIEAAQQIPMAQPEVVAVAPVRASSRSAKWLTFERKKTRQRPDQIKWLEAKRKDIDAVRGGEGERLTDNTLIRVALTASSNAGTSWPAPQKTSCADRSGSHWRTITRTELGSGIGRVPIRPVNRGPHVL